MECGICYLTHLLDDSATDSRGGPISERLLLELEADVPISAVLILLEDDSVVPGASTNRPPIPQLVRKIINLTSKGLDAVLDFHHLEGGRRT